MAGFGRDEEKNVAAATGTGVDWRMAVLLCLVLFSGRLAAQTNVLKNSGFEAGVNGWQPEPVHKLITEPGQARSGKACIWGEATKPRQALYLRQRVPVKARNLYEFEVWARATNKTKLVLWIHAPGEEARRLVAAWEKLPQRWKRFSAPISVREDGELELQVIAPSSHAAPIGQIWVDDIALYETEMPETVAVSDKAWFCDEPTLAALPDGDILVGWNSFRDGYDSLQVARFAATADGFRRTAQWQVVGGVGTYTLGPQLVAARDRAYLLFAQETGRDDWGVRAAEIGPSGPGRSVVLGKGAGIDIKPQGAWHDGRLWVCWESNRSGTRGICLTSLDEAGPGKVEAVSAESGAAYSPSLVVLPNGEICVAWHAFRDGDSDIRLRRRSPDGVWTAEQQLTRAPGIDRHARLFERNGELWLLYEHALMNGYRIGATHQRTLHLVHVDRAGQLQRPVAAGKSPLQGRCEAGNAVVDSAGRIWVAHLRPRGRRAFWDPFLTAFTGAEWAPLRRLAGTKGMDRRPAAAIVGDQFVVAVQTVPGGGRFTSRADASKDSGTIELLSTTLDPALNAAAATFEPHVEPDVPFEAPELRAAFGDADPEPATIEYRGETLHLVYGNFHEHTDVSQCNRLGDQSIDESYQHMRDLSHLDFGAATDHGYNLTPYLWSYTAKLARVNHDPETFITFLGEEWTSTFEEYSDKHPYGFYGHRNLVFADPYFPRWWNAQNRQTPADVWRELREMKADFIQIPHQIADTGNVPTDWDFTDETAQPVVEIHQVRGSYEYKGAPREAKRSTPAGYFMQDAWARGIVIGVTASPDHGGGHGKACVFTRSRTRKAILEALRKRHCFGTTATRTFLDFRVNGHLMGEKIPAADGRPVEVTIAVRCPGDIDRVEICRNNEFIYCSTPEGRQADIRFTDTEPVAGRSYYYVRVIQKDEEITWSSPVWLGAE